MSGIVGGKNHRGSGLIADLGTDGQILTSAGAGVRQIFEAAAGGTGKSYYTRIQYDATASTATTAYTGFGFAPKSLVAFNGNYPIDEAYSLGFAEKTDGNGGGKVKKEAVVTIQNIVASINLGGRIHLEQAARTLPRSMYEPEQFPGLIHRMIDPKTVILLFSSGKLVCTGAKKEPDVYRSVNNLHSLLEEKKLMLYE